MIAIPINNGQIPLALHRMCSIADAAILLGVSPRTVRNWAVLGKVPVYRTPGGSIRLWLPDCLKAGTHSPDKRRPYANKFPVATAPAGNPPPAGDATGSE